MKKRLNIPGFPPPEKQDVIRFSVFKSLPYKKRMTLYALCIAIGFLIQIIMLSVLPGAILLIFAALLTLVKGYHNKVELNAYRADSNWTAVDMEKICQVDSFNAKLKKWDQDTLDISNGIGCLTFGFAALGLIVAYVVLYEVTSGYRVGNIFVIDALILIIPIWFNGLRQIYQQNVLYIKTDLVIALESFFRTVKKNGEHFKPALMLAHGKTEKSVPTDCRFNISFDNMPADFYGIQAQININNVQGANYPYFYCVITAKAGFGLDRYVNLIPVPRNINVKYESDGEADVIVIRQHTTKTSGYHSKLPACKSILEIALIMSRMILEDV